MKPKGNHIALSAIALCGVATMSAVSQDDIDRLRAHAGTYDYEQQELAAMPQRVAGLHGQTRAFLAPSLEEYQLQLAALEGEFAREQEVLRSIELEEVAAVGPAEADATEQLIQEELEAQAALQVLAEALVEEFVAE